MIDTAALRANFGVVRARVAADVAILAVVKANAYGHGASIVAPVLAAAGADAFGVATIGEAAELRSAGIHQPILVLTPIHARDVVPAVRQRITVAVTDAEQARGLAAAAAPHRVRVHLKVDTGMGRLGSTVAELPELIAAIRSAGNLDVDGVFSHFGNADDVFTPHCDTQLAAFEEALAIVARAGFEPRWVHLANSAAALARPEAHFNLVRPGIALYGIAPACADAPELRPVMRLVTHIAQVRALPADTPVSYGQTFVTERPSRIAVLPIGYADGYSRALSNRAEVLVRGRRARVVGNVCMDLTMVDVTDVPNVAAGDEVVLFGAQDGATLGVDEVGAWQDSIGYEVLNRVGKRVPRLVA